MAGKHAVLTGDTRRFGDRVTLSDGTVVDTKAALIELDSFDQAVEVAHQIALGHVKHGHPDDIEFDEETGKTVQRPFAYDDSHYQAHVAKKKG